MNQAILGWSFRQPCDFKASVWDLVVKKPVIIQKKGMLIALKDGLEIGQNINL